VCRTCASTVPVSGRRTLTGYSCRAASHTFHDASVQWSLGVVGGVVATYISTRLISYPDKDEIGYLLHAKTLS
jgi:hypothetical protein